MKQSLQDWRTDFGRAMAYEERDFRSRRSLALPRGAECRLKPGLHALDNSRPTEVSISFWRQGRGIEIKIKIRIRRIRRRRRGRQPKGGEEDLEVFGSQLRHFLAVLVQQGFDQAALALLQGQDSLLDGADGDELVNKNRLGLANAVGAVGGLSLD